jgi:predicted nucleic acid binding AN1-type Zn finger protein
MSEFDHVGSHCTLPTCKQRDFLPFTCDTCKKPYCLAHRSYDAHNCEGALKRDMTSLDCPICGKSFKFDKSKDPNEIWEEHYNFYCTKTESKSSSSSSSCARKGCISKLGPSNTFQCPKCLKKVCLSHRMSEEHECVGATNKSRNNSREHVLPKAHTTKKIPIKPTPAPVPAASSSSNPREAFLQRVESNSFRHSGKPPAKSSSSPRVPASSSSASRDNQGVQNNSASESYVCPFCGISESSVDVLSAHVEQHLNSTQQTTAIPPTHTSSSNSNPMEVSSARFRYF